MDSRAEARNWIGVVALFVLAILFVSTVWYFSIWQSKKIPSGKKADKIIYELRQEAKERADKN